MALVRVKDESDLTKRRVEAQNLLLVYQSQESILSEQEEASTSLEVGKRAGIEELSSASKKYVLTCKIQRELCMKYRETQLHPFLLYWSSLLEFLEPNVLMPAKNSGLAREFFSSNWTNRDNVIKLCADSIQKEGVAAGPLVFQTLLSLWLENTESVHESICEHLLKRICYYFPSHAFSWIFFLHSLLPPLRMNTSSTQKEVTKLSLPVLLHLVEVHIASLKKEQSSSPSVSDAHSYTARLQQSCSAAALVAGYEALARLKLALGKIDECAEVVQLGVEAIEKCKSETLFGNGKSFFETWKNFQLILAVVNRTQENTKKALEIYRYILSVNENCVEALEGEGEILFEKEDNAAVLAIVKKVLKISPSSHWGLAYRAWFDYQVFVREEKKMRIAAQAKMEKKEKNRAIGGKTRLIEEKEEEEEKDEAIVDEEDYDTKAVMTLIGFRNKIQEASNARPWAPHFHFWLGRILWSMGGESRKAIDKAKSEFLLASTKSDVALPLTPSVVQIKALSIEWLGNWYAVVSEDLKNAGKCWKKALAISPKLERIGLRLAKTYISQSKLEKAKKLLTRAADEGQTWPLFNLGLLDIHFEKYSEAILHIQGAIRQDPESVIAWQTLATAYAKQGKYVAAIKVAKKILEMVDVSDEKLREKHWYTYYQIGIYNLRMGMYEDAIVYLQLASQQQVLTLKAMADTHRHLSMQDFKLGHQRNAKLHLDKAREALEKATEVISKSGKNSESYYSIWKYLGDICTQYFNFARDDATMSKLEEGVKAYRMAIQDNRGMASLYYDVGLNYWKQSQLAEETAGKDPKKYLDLLELASSNLTNAISLKTQDLLDDHNELLVISKSGNLGPKGKEKLEKQRHLVKRHEQMLSDYWNALGMTKKGFPHIQQHCFIRSLQYRKDNSEALVNIVLVLLEKFPELDTESLPAITDYCVEVLAQAEQVHPKGSVAWMLDGVVQHVLHLQTKSRDSDAQATHKKGGREEEKILRHYQHSFRLSPSFLSAFGLAIASGSPKDLTEDEWITIKYVLETAVRERPKDPAAHYLLGLHLSQPPAAHQETIARRSFDAEKSFDTDSEVTVDPVKCFRRVYVMLMEEVKAKKEESNKSPAGGDFFSLLPDSESSLDTSAKLRRVALSLAFSLLDLQQPDEALKILEESKAHFAPDLVFYMAYIRIYADKRDFTKTKEFSELASPLVAAADKPIRRNFLLWQAKLYLQTANEEGVRGVIRECMKEFSTDAQALLVSGALGVILKNQAATKAGLDKLRALREKLGAELAEKEFDLRWGLLESVAHVMKDDREKALRTIEKSVLMHPEDGRVRLRLSHFVQDNFASESAKQFFTKTPKIHHAIRSPTDTLYDYESLSTLIHSYLNLGGVKNVDTLDCSLPAFRKAQNLVHALPFQPRSWYLLSIASYGLTLVNPNATTKPLTWETVKSTLSTSISMCSKFHPQHQHMASLCAKEQKLVDEYKQHLSLLLVGVECHLGAENSENAKKIVEKIRAGSEGSFSNSQLKALAYRQEAAIFLAAKDEKKAKSLLQQAIKEDPSNVKLWIELAYIYQHSNQTDAAVSCLEKYQELNPKTPTNLENHVLADIFLAHALYDKGSFVPANRKLVQLIQLPPPYKSHDYSWRPLVLGLKALTELKLGNKNNYGTWLAKVKEISPLVANSIDLLK
eukprot:TRINITY_DN8082_c0_g1_i1.p1 TRINITY_DN8082_c0_g1~~TRINITY_DN8082_c0_g1_i1.p1  ORF type:complete len:1805 (-),score=479.17 TRINITY_DN8082_c0_g1_i1:90-5093(-)